MKTTDLIYQNQKVLNAMHNSVLQSKNHIEFLAAYAPEIRTNLESVAESMQTLADTLEYQIVFNRDTLIRFAKECACKNQAYDFIMTEQLSSRFGLFMHCCPVETYLNKTGLDIFEKPENK